MAFYAYSTYFLLFISKSEFNIYKFMDRIFIIILSLLAFTNPICWFDLHRIADYWNNWIEFQVHVVNNIIKLNYIHLLWINQSNNHI